MGYGYGYSSRSDHGGKRYNNSQVAHVWNSQSERRGQSNNGNAYFSGAALFSYGSHFLTGYIMPDGVALLNADSYSISTSGHQSDAWSATSNRPRFNVAGLTPLLPLLESITAKRVDKATARRMIRDHAEALAAAVRFDPGESGRYWREGGSESGKESAGAYLTRAAGLPARSWPKLEREAAALKAKREAEAAKHKRERLLATAIRAADMSGAEWRIALSIADENGGTYGAERRLKAVALDLFHAVRTAKVEGLSKRRRAIISARHKEARQRLADLAELTAIVDKRDSIRRNVRTLRETLERWQTLATAGELPSYHLIRNLDYAAKAADDLALSAMLPAASRSRLAFQARMIRTIAERLESERSRYEAEQRERETALRALELAEYRVAWLAGNAPQGFRRFDADSGGAALRIKGDMLQTSHGAEVPLEHAIRAFRFIKLCREAGRAWHANGQQIRVGHFRVDSISPEGNMIAGCHSFTWPEIQRAAIAAGVFDCPADDSAVRVSLKESA
jgi:hypothetical protein